MSDTNNQNVNEVIKERFSSLPKIVQNAILSAGVETHLRTLAETHKLHLDQWQVLENQVMLTLLGFYPIEDLGSRIEHEIDLDHETANTLATDISKVVFEPIRAELAHELDAPKEESPITSPPRPVGFSASAPVPATPPPAPPVVKSLRAVPSGEYRPGEASTARASVDDDPYREAPA